MLWEDNHLLLAIFFMLINAASLSLAGSPAIVSNKNINKVDDQPKISPHIFSYPEDANRFIQSDLCRDEEIQSSLQCFKVLPEESYEVLVGDNVLMRCIVANQKGKAQWRFGERMLGFNREIPFKPRLAMIGDESAGDQSLLIKNVTASDAGEYECQVTRGTHGKKELRRATQLVVLVPPTKPLIYENNNKQPSKIVLIPISSRPSENSNKKMNLKCIARSGYPTPFFEWFHNSKQLTPTSPGVSIRDEKDSSYLTFRVISLMNGDTVSCVVYNKATLRMRRKEDQRPAASVQIVVNTLPGSPKIFDIENKVVVFENAPLTVSCRSQPAGEPPGILHWSIRTKGKTEQYKDVPHIKSHWISTFNDSGALISRLLIPNVSQVYHGAFLLCLLKHELLDDQNDQIQILVEYGPENLTIDSSLGKPRLFPTDKSSSQWADVPKIFMNVHQKVLLRCSTSKYYGEVRLQWYIHEASTSSQKVWKQLDNIVTQTNFIEEKLKKIQVADLEINHSSTHFFVLKCEATANHGHKVANYVILETLNLPSSPILTASNDLVEAGSNVTLLCYSNNGNPPPKLVLYKGSSVIYETSEINQSNQVEMKYSFTATKEMNMDAYRCILSSAHRLYESLKSNEVTIRVLYSPSSLEMTSSQPAPWLAGKFYSFICSTDESNPAADVKWSLYDCSDVLPNVLDPSQLHRCYSRILESKDLVKPGKWKGSYIKESTVKMLLGQENNNNMIQCSVNSQSKHQSHMYQNKLLNVTFAPNFESNTKFNYVVREGEPITITVEPKANPPVHEYQWLSEGLEIPHSQVLRLRKNALTIIRADVDMMRSYSLIGRNSVGTGSFTFKLNVTFCPRVIGRDYLQIFVRASETNANLTCEAQSNPAGSSTSIHWVMLDKLYNARILKTENSHMIEKTQPVTCDKKSWSSDGKYVSFCTETGPISVKGVLHLFRLAPSDSGRYRCVINNSIDSPASKIVNLNIPVAPRVIHFRRLKFSGAELGQSAKLTTWIFSYPAPKIIWYRESSNLTLINGKKFSTSFVNFRSGLFKATLSIDFIKKADFQSYFCQVSNDLGTVTSKIQLIPATYPDIPYNVQILDRSSTSITLSWNQGFNGGFEQIFTISWRKVDYVHPTVDNTGQLAENNEEEDIRYTIRDLQPASLYEIRLCSHNLRYQTCQFAAPISVKTLESSDADSQNKTNNSPKTSTPIAGRMKSDNLVITITSVSVFVFVILVINILFVSFYLRKRRRKQQNAMTTNKIENSLGYIQCSTMEMYPMFKPNLKSSSINEMSANTSQRSVESSATNKNNESENRAKSANCYYERDKLGSFYPSIYENQRNLQSIKLDLLSDQYVSKEQNSFLPAISRWQSPQPDLTISNSSEHFTGPILTQQSFSDSIFESSSPTIGSKFTCNSRDFEQAEWNSAAVYPDPVTSRARSNMCSWWITQSHQPSQ